MGRRKKRDILRFVFECALQDRVTLLDALSGCSKEEQDAVKADMRAIVKLKLELIGPDNGPDPTDGLVSKDFLLVIHEILEQFETNEEGVVMYDRPKQPKTKVGGNDG